MAQTTLSGPLVLGDKQAGLANSPTTGFVPCVQFVTIARDATLVQNATIYLPKGSQITNIVPDVTVAYDSATSATLSVGTASAGTQYVSGVNAKTAGRAAPAYTAAQLTNMSAIGTNDVLVATVTSVGQPTVGTIVLAVHYVQKASSTD